MQVQITRFNWNRPRPSRESNLVAWNESWEADLRDFYDTAKTSIITTNTIYPKWNQFIEENQQKLQLGHELFGIRNVVYLQHDIRHHALPKLALGNLEEAWKSLIPKDRERIVLQALSMTAIKIPGVEHHRKWCPEMTIANFTENEGQYLIDLLETIITQDPVAIWRYPQPVAFPNPLVESIMQTSYADNKLGDTTRKALSTLRNFYISSVVWQILQGMFGTSKRHWSESEIPMKGHDRKYIVDQSRKIGGQHFAHRIGREYKEIKNEQDRAFNICWVCEKSATTLQPGLQLMACAKCKAVNYTVRYCSREGQREDWKNGKPRPHKEICGKNPASENNQVERSHEQQNKSFGDCSSSTLMIPDPSPNFIRSPALIYQIIILQEFPNYDYVIFKGNDSSGYIALVLPENDLRLKWGWLMLRRRAFETGDEATVNEMFEVLKDCAEGKGIPVATLEKQIKKEYGVTAKTGQQASWFTKEELEHAEMCRWEMEQLRMGKDDTAPDPNDVG